MMEKNIWEIETNMAQKNRDMQKHEMFRGLQVAECS